MKIHSETLIVIAEDVREVTAPNRNHFKVRFLSYQQM
jgi:hypothetical protein